MHINLSKIIFLNILFLNIGFIFSTTEEFDNGEFYKKFDTQKNIKEALKRKSTEIFENELYILKKINKDLNRDFKNDILNKRNQIFYEKTENVLSNLSICIKENKLFNRNLDENHICKKEVIYKNLKDLSDFHNGSLDKNTNISNDIKIQDEFNLQRKVFLITQIEKFLNYVSFFNLIILL